ncbi:MAG: hypothetical protein KAG97_01875 [Victivallales bacterium]|nr:hypothetical protein [Victivallales bacterium]
MGILKKIFGHDEKPKYNPPDVTFIDEDESAVTHTIPIAVKPSKQKIVIKEGDEIMVFDSIGQVPEEMREAVEHLGEDGASHQTYSVIVNGERKNYNSLEELPKEIRESLKSDGAAG